MSEQVWPRGMNKALYPSPQEWVKLLGPFAEEIINEAHEGARNERRKRINKRNFTTSTESKRVRDASPAELSL